jgi:hypothetical protein
MPADAGEAATLDGVYSRLNSGNAEMAAGELIRWWQALYWPIRVAAVTAVLGVFLMLFFSSAVRTGDAGSNLLASVFLMPIAFGAIVALARPEPALDRMARFIRWSAMKRDRARASDRFVTRWFFRPLYGSLCGSATATVFIKEPYLRTGVMIALQFFAVYVALMIAYAAIAIVVAFVFLMIVIWIMSLILSEGSGGGGSSSRHAVRKIASRSRQRTGFFGNQYIQHQDDQGHNTGYTEQRTDFFGRPYQQHFSQEGGKAGYSEEQQGFFGNRYVQHLNQEGTKAGYSEDRQGFFGNEYLQHYDERGNKAGRSEVRKDFLGNEYVKHEDE